MYLKQFADGNNRFCVLNLKDRNIYCGVPCESQCYKNYFYGKDCVLEDSLSEKESQWSQLFYKISNQTDIAVDLSTDEKTLLIEFAVFQRQRTDAETNFANSEKLAIQMEYVKSVCAHREWTFDEETLKDKVNNIKITPAESLAFVKDILSYVDDLNVAVIKYETENCLISSDVPVVSINSFVKQNIGYASMGLIMLYPIDLHRLIVVYDDGMYGYFKGRSYITSKDENEVNHLNILQYIFSDKIVYGIRRTEFEKFDTDISKLRTKNRNQKPITVLGSDTNKFKIGFCTVLVF